VFINKNWKTAFKLGQLEKDYLPPG
jgi:hypothetical protein